MARPGEFGGEELEAVRSVSVKENRDGYRGCLLLIRMIHVEAEIDPVGGEAENQSLSS